MRCGMMDTTHTKQTPFCLHDGRDETLDRLLAAIAAITSEIDATASYKCNVNEFIH